MISSNLRIRNAGIAAALIIGLGSAGHVLLSRLSESKPAISTEHKEEAVGQQSLISAVPPRTLGTLAAPAVSAPASQAPKELRKDRIDRLLASPLPADRLQAANELALCGQVQVLNVIGAQANPSMASTLYADINTYCDGLSSDQLSRRFQVLEELAKERVGNSAVLYSDMTPDGVLMYKASKDANYAAWYAKALGYLKESARVGEYSAVEQLSMHYRVADNKDPYEHFVYRLAHQDSHLGRTSALRGMSAERLAKERQAVLDQVISSFSKQLTPAQIAKAQEEGLAISAKVVQRSGS